MRSPDSRRRARRRPPLHARAPDAQRPSRTPTAAAEPPAAVQHPRQAPNAGATLSLDPVLRAILDRFADGAAIHRGDRLLYANPAFARLLEWPLDDLIGRSWEEFMHPDDRERARQNVRASLAAPHVPITGTAERRLFGFGGKEVTVQLSAVAFEIGGQATLLIVAHDLSARKNLEIKLRDAERMAAVGALAAGVAHEINNPLAYVIGNLAFARETLGEMWGRSVGSREQSVSEAIDEAYEGVRRMKQVVGDLKTFARGDESHVAAVDLVPVVRSTLKMAKSELQHRARVHTDLCDGARVWANEARLAQVFLNLFVNAGQAIAEGALEQNEIRVTVSSDAQRAYVVVSDTGSGIPAEVLPRVTEPFFTTKPVGVGTGLGLSVCKRIVEGYGGELRIESTVGIGTRVTVVLPRAPSGPTIVAPNGLHAAVGKRSRRILIIDDDPMVLRAMRRSLRQHTVEHAASGSDAIRVLSRDRAFDVILCDLMMPGLTGMDVYEAVTREWPDLLDRLVFVTGGAVTEKARAFLAQVSNARYEKPLEPEQLESIVQRFSHDATDG